MNDKTRRGLYIVAGAYLTYLGIQLLAGMNSGSLNQTVALASGIVFCVFGVGLIVNVIRNILKSRKDDSAIDEKKECECIEEAREE